MSEEINHLKMPTTLNQRIEKIYINDSEGLGISLYKSGGNFYFEFGNGSFRQATISEAIQFLLLRELERNTR